MARPASDIRERLLDAALNRFAAVGVGAASLREIATEAETSVGMIAYHFDSKDGLFLALARQFYSRLVADLEELAAANPAPIDRLRAVLGRIAALGAEELQAVRMVMRELSINSERIEQLAPMVFDGHVRILAVALQEGIERGDIRQIPVFPTIPTLLAPIIVPQLVPLPAFVGLDRADFVNTAIDVALHGLLPRSG